MPGSRNQLVDLHIGTDFVSAYFLDNFAGMEDQVALGGEIRACFAGMEDPVALGGEIGPCLHGEMKDRPLYPDRNAALAPFS